MVKLKDVKDGKHGFTSVSTLSLNQGQRERDRSRWKKGIKETPFR